MISSEEWQNQFSPRDVIALSANPLFVEPLKYIGDAGYVSDTEDSIPITESKQEASSIEVSIDPSVLCGIRSFFAFFLKKMNFVLMRRGHACDCNGI